MISEMAGFQIFDTIFKKINPGNQICGCNHCVPHWTKQFRLILSLPWRRDKSSQTNRLVEISLGQHLREDSCIRPEPSELHLKHTRTAYTRREISSALSTTPDSQQG